MSRKPVAIQITKLRMVSRDLRGRISEAVHYRSSEQVSGTSENWM